MTPSLARAKAIAKKALGAEGRMISHSKSGYSRRRPTNVCAFNARVVVALTDGYCENVWWGDVDLTLWEQRLAALARLLERRVYLLYEGDDRGNYPREPREFALACFSPSGAADVPERHSSYIVRAQDGTLRRFIEPEARRRWRWRVLLHRPRLWQLWTIERRKRLLYLGALSGGASPLLVLGRFREQRMMSTNRWLEWTWYPAGGDERAAARSLLDIKRELRLGHTVLWLRVLVWPERVYQLYLGAVRLVGE